MEFFTSLKRFFQLPSTKQNEHEVYTNERDMFNRFEVPEDESEDDGMGINIFTSPLEMHRYFEQQFNTILKSFGMIGDESFMNDSSHFELSPFFNADGTSKQEGNLRDQFLKPGYHSTTDDKKVDGDLDGKINLDDLDKVLDKGVVSKFERRPTMNFFSQSVSTKTIRMPDGTIETRRTVRDGEGNEETTITKKKGEQEYSVTKRKNKNGEEETVENIINMNENQVQNFLKNNEDNGNDFKVDKIPPNWFPFDKFFR